MSKTRREQVRVLAFDSELELPTLRAIAKRAELPEPVTLDIIRDYVYDLRAEVTALRHSANRRRVFA